MLPISSTCWKQHDTDNDSIHAICASSNNQLIAIASTNRVTFYWSVRSECVRIGQYKHTSTEDGSITGLRFNQSRDQIDQINHHQLSFLTSNNILVICDISTNSSPISLTDPSHYDHAILAGSSDHWKDPLIADSVLLPSIRVHLTARVRLTNDDIAGFAPSINPSSQTSNGWMLSSNTGFLQSIDEHGKPGLCRGDMSTPITMLESSASANLIVFVTADGRVHSVNHGAVNLQESTIIADPDSASKPLKAVALSINDVTGILAIGYENASVKLYRLSNSRVQYLTRFSIKHLPVSTNNQQNDRKQPSADQSIAQSVHNITSLSLHPRALMIAIGLSNGSIIVTDFSGCILYEKQYIIQAAQSIESAQSIEPQTSELKVADPASVSDDQTSSIKSKSVTSEKSSSIDTTPIFAWCSNGFALICSHKNSTEIERISFLLQSTMLSYSDSRQDSAPFVGETAIAVIKQRPSFDNLKRSSRRRPQPRCPKPINQSSAQNDVDNDENPLEGLPRLSLLTLIDVPPSFLSFASPLLISCISPRSLVAAVAARQGLALVDLHTQKWYTYHLPVPVHVQQIGFYGEDCVVCMIKAFPSAYTELHYHLSSNKQARIQRLVDPLDSSNQQTKKNSSDLMTLILFFSRGSLDIRNALYCIEIEGECASFDIDHHTLAVCNSDVSRVCFLSLDATIKASNSVSKAPSVASAAVQYVYHPHNQFGIDVPDIRAHNTSVLPYSLSFSQSCSTARPSTFHSFIAVVTTWISLPSSFKHSHITQLAIQEARRIFIVTNQQVQVFTVNQSISQSKESVVDCSASGDHLFLPPHDISELNVADSAINSINQSTKLNRALRSLRLSINQQTDLTAFLNHPSRSPWSVDPVRLLTSEFGEMNVGIDWHHAALLCIKPNSLMIRSRPFLDQLAAHCIKLNALPFVRDLLSSCNRADSTSSLAAELLVNQALNSPSSDAYQLSTILSLLKNDDLFVRTIARVARQNDAHRWPALFKAARCTPAECASRAMNEGQYDVSSWLLTVVQRTHSLKEARIIAKKLISMIPFSYEYVNLHRTVRKFMSINQSMIEEQELIDASQAKSINQSTVNDQSINQSISQSMNPPILVPAASAPPQSINQSVNQSINQSPPALRSGSEPIQSSDTANTGSCVIS